MIFDEPRDTGDGIHPGEPGYLKAMTDVFKKYIPDHLGQLMNGEEFKKLHDACVENVGYGRQVSGQKYVCDHAFPTFEPGYYPNSKYFLDMRDVTPEARKEWETKNLMGEYGVCRFEESDQTIHSLFWMGPYAAHLRVNYLFKQYYIEIAQAKTEDERLAAIVDLCRALEMMHGFADANQRTIAFALLTKLLVENRLSPALLDRPNMFDGYFGTREMIELVIQGQKNYQQLRQTWTPGETHTDVSPVFKRFKWLWGSCC